MIMSGRAWLLAGHSHSTRRSRCHYRACDIVRNHQGVSISQCHTHGLEVSLRSAHCD